MGISYSAVKTTVPEAWEIGKDYYGLTDLFPTCAGREMKIGLRSLFSFVPPLSDLPHIVGSRHPFITNAVFVVTDIYKTADEMISMMTQLKKAQMDRETEAHFRGFHHWAGDDPIQFISDFDELEDREAVGEYNLCAAPNSYKHADSWGSKANRKVGR